MKDTNWLHLTCHGLTPGRKLIRFLIYLFSQKRKYPAIWKEACSNVRMSNYTQINNELHLTIHYHTLSFDGMRGENGDLHLDLDLAYLKWMSN